MEEPSAEAAPGAARAPPGHGSRGRDWPAAMWYAYLSCEQPKELAALTVLCLIFFVLTYGGVR